MTCINKNAIKCLHFPAAYSILLKSHIHRGEYDDKHIRNTKAS